MGARRIQMVCIESSYGVAKTTPTLGTDKFYPRLDRDGAFVYTDEIQQIPISYGGGFAIEADTAVDAVVVKGTFNYRLSPGVVSDILLKWAIVGINSERTTPWVTTDSAGVMPVGDFASLSFYEAVLKEDGATYDRKVLRGAKCDTWELTANETGEGRVWSISGSFTAIRVQGNPMDASTDPDATEFPLPAETDYPSSWWLFSHLASSTGAVNIGGSNRKATVSALTMRGSNIYGPNYYTSKFLSTYRWVGRSVSQEATLRYKASPDDRASYRSATALASSVVLDNGTNTITLDYKSHNILRPWGRQVPNESEYMQTLTLANRWHKASAADLTLTLT